MTYDKNNDGNFINGKCKRCHLERTKDDHDPCIPNLPGVKYACCGHGDYGYIYFENGALIRYPVLYEIRSGVNSEDSGKEIVYDPGVARWPSKCTTK